MWNIGSFSFEWECTLVRRANRSFIKAKFSFACQKRTRNPSRAGGAGDVFLSVKRLALRAGQRQGGVFRLPPPYLWTPLSPQRVKGCSPLTIPKKKSKPKNASRFAKRIFCASPIYGSADDFTSSLNFTPCKGVTPAAKQQVGETRKKRLAQRPAFFRFDNSLGV